MAESTDRTLDPIRTNALSNATAVAIALAHTQSPMTTEEMVKTAKAFENFLAGADA